jgi:polysaccharide export outer membrane protein
MCTLFHNSPCPSAYVLVALLAVSPAMVGAQEATGAAQPPAQQPTSPSAPVVRAPANGTPPTPGVELPPEYVIGPEDVIGVHFWKDTEMTGDHPVRPDGRITLPLLGDIVAAGQTPDALAAEIQKLALKFQKDPTVNVIVRQINSRKVFITGQVTTPGAYPLVGPRTVMQAITLAGGVTEYADKKNITVIRMDGTTHKVNYSDLSKGKNLKQNILLKPGDQIIVP